MAEIFVNLKRFDVPKKFGGICPQADPEEWIQSVITKTIEFGLGKSERLHLTYLLPESLLIPALRTKNKFARSESEKLDIGCQSVFRENIAPGGNFGAFTSNLPASAASGLGCTWTMIGHSEERKDKFEMIAEYDSLVLSDLKKMQKANYAINSLLNKAVLKALESGLNVLVCVGETAEERGQGSFDQQKPKIAKVLKSQLEISLKGTEDFSVSKKIIIGYEPRWAIGPGKKPPGADYISFVSALIKKEVKDLYGYIPAVVYGGGLKEENAKMISDIPTIDGGLVALTRFTGDIGFAPDELKSIIEKYLE
ncbi:MAG: triose-phosphate isomerase [Desulfobacterales bacterium]|jgi:triosephosphate isomerase